MYTKHSSVITQGNGGVHVDRDTYKNPKYKPELKPTPDDQLDSLTRDELVELLEDYKRVEDVCAQMWEKISTRVMDMDERTNYVKAIKNS
jgi:hypothetical protein